MAALARLARLAAFASRCGSLAHEAMTAHCEIAADFTGRLGFGRHVQDAVHYQHERYDGRGYPSGLRGEDTPLGAAIICVADTYDTMTTDRPYRRAPGLEEARAEIARCSGSQFNPLVVEAFMRASASAQWQAAPQQRATDLPQTRTLGDQANEINTRAMRVVYQIAQLIGTVTDLPPARVR